MQAHKISYIASDSDPKQQVRNILLQATTAQVLAAGQYLRMPDAGADEVLYVEQGCIARCIENEEGCTMVAIHGAESLLIDCHANDNDDAAVWRARMDSRIRRLPLVRYLLLLRQQPELLDWTIREQALQMSQSHRRIQEFCRQPAVSRVFSALQRLVALQPGGARVSEALRITREELGELAGCTRKTAAAALHDLMNQGLVRLQGRLIFVDGGVIR